MPKKKTNKSKKLLFVIPVAIILSTTFVFTFFIPIKTDKHAYESHDQKIQEQFGGLPSDPPLCLGLDDLLTGPVKSDTQRSFHILKGELPLYNSAVEGLKVWSGQVACTYELPVYKLYL